MTDPDADLVRRLQARDRTAIDEVVRLYRSRIFGFACRLLRDEQDAEEITQDTLLVAWTRIHQFKGDSTLFSWLMTITRNRCCNRYAWKRRRGSQITVSMQQEVGDNGLAQLEDLVPSTACSVQREAEIAEFQVEADGLLAKLNDKERKIMVLSLQGKTYAQLTATLGIESGTVKSRLARARQKLRWLLDAKDPALCDLRPERSA